MKNISKRVRYYFENYRFNSLLFKNIYMLLILIVIPIVGAVFLGGYAYENIRRNETQYYKEKIALGIGTKFNEILEESRVELMYFGHNPKTELYFHDSELKQIYYKISDIQELIKMPVIVKDYVDSVYIYSANNGYVIGNNNVNKYESFEQKDIFECYRKSKNPQKYFMITQTVKAGSPWQYLSVYQGIDYGRNITGILVMNIDIKSVVREMEVPEEVKFCIAEEEKILLSSEVNLIGKTISEVEWGVGDNSIFSTYDETSEVDILLYMDKDYHEDELGDIRFFIVMFIGVTVWIAVVLAMFIAVRLFQPIEKIVTSIREYNSVLTGGDGLFLEKDELEYVLKNIQKIASVKVDVEKEIVERMRLLRKAQAVALQAQITPHFINNTLESMNWMAMELFGRKNEISEMAGGLSKMLRMSLENTDVVVPVRTEIEHCKCYLGIQMKRYENKFDVVWDISEDVYDCRIIKIVLQPLVENAICHGVKNLSGKGRISINGRIFEGKVELSVTDNGLGMSQEKLKRLQRIIKSEEIKESMHIGVANVNQRLKLYFGEEYMLIIKSEEGVGTTVTIRIPRV